MDERQIQQVRSFNRAVTRRIGALSDDYLGRGRPLAESRLLFEIGHAGADLRDLRARLGLDSGYLSRLLRGLESQGLLRTRASRSDARVREAQLSAKGRREVDELEQRSQALAASLLAPLSARQRERMAAAMDDVERLLRELIDALERLRLIEIVPDLIELPAQSVAIAEPVDCDALRQVELARQFEALHRLKVGTHVAGAVHIGDPRFSQSDEGGQIGRVGTAELGGNRPH